jgi:hypothetical protein
MPKISVLGKPFNRLLLSDLEKVQSLRERTVYPKGQERYIKPVDISELENFLAKSIQHLPDESEEVFWGIGESGAFSTIQEAISSPDVVDGHVLFLENGVYEIDTTLIINKEISLIGESRDGVLIKNADSWGDSTNLISVTKDNVTLRNLTIRQVSTNANAFSVSAQTSNFPFQKLYNFKMIDCKVEYSKHGVYYRVNKSVMLRVELEVVAGTGTRYGLLPSANSGDSFIVGCHFNHPLALIANNRLVYLNGIGGPDSDRSWEGSMTVANCTSEGFVAQFINHDSLVGSVGAFDLIVVGNVMAETNAFAVSVGTNIDLYGSVVFKDNVLTNKHVGGTEPGKGMFFLDSISTRTSPLSFYANNNVLEQTTLRATEVDAPNSTEGTSLVTIRATAKTVYDNESKDAVDFSIEIPSDLPDFTNLDGTDIDITANELIENTILVGDISLSKIQSVIPVILTENELLQIQRILSIDLIATGSFLLSKEHGVIAKAKELGWIKVFNDEGYEI